MHKMEPTTTEVHINELQLHTSVWISLKTIMMHEKKQVTEKYIPGDFTYGSFKKHAKLDNTLCRIMCVYVN